MSWLTNMSQQALEVRGVGTLPAGWSAEVADSGPAAVTLYCPEDRGEDGEVVEPGSGGLSPDLFKLTKTKPKDALVLGVDDQPSAGATRPSLAELTEQGRELHGMQPDDGVPADLVLDPEPPVVLIPDPPRHDPPAETPALATTKEA